MRPSIEPFTPLVVGPKPWGTELLVAHSPDYIGKCLYMKAGHQGGLQFHRTKDEAFFLFSGEAYVRFDPGGDTGKLQTALMKPGMAFRIPPGAVHQVEAITDCVFFETSTPVFDDRVNVGSEYGCPDSGESR